MDKTEIYKENLENGVQVVTLPMMDVQTVTAFLFVNTGSNYEEQKLSGISHYLEHLFFKGSDKYKTPIEISSILDGVGAAYNAYTSEEITAFYVKLMKDKLEIALDVMSDFLKNPLFTETEIEREKNVILEELNMYYDMPQRRIYDLFKQTVYGDQPAGRDVGGVPETVNSITRNEVVDYFDKQYKGENMVLVFAGNITKEKAMEFAHKHFDDIKQGKDEIEKEMVVLENNNSPKIEVEKKDTDQTHIMFGFPSYDMTSDKKYALKVLSNILGGGMSSRLFNEVREKRGLCYSIHAGNDLGSDFGYTYVKSGIAKGKTEEALKAVVDILKDIKENSVTTEELQRTKNNIEGHTYLGLENTDEVASFWGVQYSLTGEAESPNEFIEKIKSVTVEEVKEVANEVLIKEKACLSIIGNDQDTENLKNIMLEI